ncbi:hypothetical protein LINPERHAP2_LOCUS27118 [Linum perenne]
MKFTPLWFRGDMYGYKGITSTTRKIRGISVLFLMPLLKLNCSGGCGLLKILVQWVKKSEEITIVMLVFEPAEEIRRKPSSELESAYAKREDQSDSDPRLERVGSSANNVYDERSCHCFQNVKTLFDNNHLHRGLFAALDTMASRDHRYIVVHRHDLHEHEHDYE